MIPVPVIAVCLEVLIVTDNRLVFEGFENGIADLWEHPVIFGVAFDEFAHLFSDWRIFDYKLKDISCEVQALDLMTGYGSIGRDI